MAIPKTVVFRLHDGFDVEYTDDPPELRDVLAQALQQEANCLRSYHEELLRHSPYRESAP